MALAAMSPRADVDDHHAPSLVRVRINYNGGNAILHGALLRQIQQQWSRRHFIAWSLARSWHNGPHALLTVDTRDHFHDPAMIVELRERIAAFLAAHPSPACDAARYIEMQTQLNTLESAGIDPSWLADNNSFDISTTSAAKLAARFESVEQWQSVFSAECRLRAIAIRFWTGSADREHTMFCLLVLLACIYPPKPSTDPEVNEFNGFLSYHSNFRFWHHRLSPGQQQAIDLRFERDYLAERTRCERWLADLPALLETGERTVRDLGMFVRDAYFEHVRMARRGAIHARSPYPLDQVADKRTISDFHQRYFHAGDGTASRFSIEFSGYRWLLNIVYRNFPSFEIPPLRRQYLNYSLDRLQRERPAEIEAVRHALLDMEGP